MKYNNKLQESLIQELENASLDIKNEFIDQIKQIFTFNLQDFRQQIRREVQNTIKRTRYKNLDQLRRDLLSFDKGQFNIDQIANKISSIIFHKLL